MKYKAVLLSFLMLFFAAVAFAQTKEEKAVAAAVENLRIAMIDGNKTALENAVSDSLSYGHSSGKVQGKQEFVDKIVTGQSDFVSITLTNQTIAVVDNTAIVRHRLNAVTNDNNKPGTVELDILLIFQKQHKHWLLLARQAVKVVHDK